MFARNISTKHKTYFFDLLIYFKGTVVSISIKISLEKISFAYCSFKNLFCLKIYEYLILWNEKNILELIILLNFDFFCYETLTSHKIFIGKYIKK